MARSRDKAKKAEILTLEEAVARYMHDGIVCAFSRFHRVQTGTRRPLHGRRSGRGSRTFTCSIGTAACARGCSTLQVP